MEGGRGGHVSIQIISYLLFVVLNSDGNAKMGELQIQKKMKKLKD